MLGSWQAIKCRNSLKGSEETALFPKCAGGLSAGKADISPFFVFLSYACNSALCGDATNDNAPAEVSIAMTLWRDWQDFSAILAQDG
jgi:hypothetical protein